MADAAALGAMFGGKIEQAVVEVVLESCNNDVDKAIDQLLQMSEEQDLHEEEQQQQGDQVNHNEQQKQREEGVDVAGEGQVQDLDDFELSSKWRNPLPDDFLALPAGVLAAGRDEQQIQQDLLFARMIADENFRNELSQHAEFRGHLRRQTQQGQQQEQRQQQQNTGVDWAGSWNELSEAAKTKFTALATRFRRQNDDYAPLNSLMPSGNPAARRRPPQRGDREAASSTSASMEMTSLDSMSRMKIQ